MQVLSWLLEHTSLDVNATNDSEEGALAEAATMGHTDAMWSLIKAGASLGEPGSVAAGSLFHSAVRHTQVCAGCHTDRHGSHGRLPQIAWQTATGCMADCHGSPQDATRLPEKAVCLGGPLGHP